MDKAAERGDVEEKAAERSGKAAERSGKAAERGPFVGLGYQQAVAQDIFERVSALGGLLVVAMVTPMPAVSRNNNGDLGPKARAIAAVAQKAKDRNTEDENLRRANDARFIRRIAEAVKEKQPV
jgi:hypothetical protein